MYTFDSRETILKIGCQTTRLPYTTAIGTIKQYKL